MTFSDYKEWRWPFDRKFHARRSTRSARAIRGWSRSTSSLSELGTAAEDNALGYAFIRNRGKTRRCDH